MIRSETIRRFMPLVQRQAGFAVEFSELRDVPESGRRPRDVTDALHYLWALLHTYNPAAWSQTQIAAYFGCSDHTYPGMALRSMYREYGKEYFASLLPISNNLQPRRVAS